MSSAAAASWVTRYAARNARGQCVRKSASRSETDPRCAPRTRARSSRASRIACPEYDGTCPRGPCQTYATDGTRGPRDLAALPERMQEGGQARISRRRGLRSVCSRRRALGARRTSRRWSGRLCHRRSREPRRRAEPRRREGRSGVSAPRAPHAASRAVHGRSAVVAHTEPGLVSIVDAVARDVRFELDGFSAPRYTAVHPLSSVAYVTDSTRQEVVALDVDRGRVVSRTRVPGPARHVTIGPDGSTLWTALGSKAERIAILDLRDPSPAARADDRDTVPRSRRRLRPTRPTRVGDVR